MSCLPRCIGVLVPLDRDAESRYMNIAPPDLSMSKLNSLLWILSCKSQAFYRVVLGFLLVRVTFDRAAESRISTCTGTWKLPPDLNMFKRPRSHRGPLQIGSSFGFFESRICPSFLAGQQNALVFCPLFLFTFSGAELSKIAQMINLSFN